MCGLAGILSHKQHVDQILKNMLNATKHRGPDYSGTWSDEFAYLGHNRLSIIDLSENGNQPMTSSCGRYTMVLNGEVYNFNELKVELSHIPFKSSSDTEVVLELWALKKEACLAQLRGMFAFAVWDHELKTLTLARDQFGIKPIYYYQNNDYFVFCSELKGMLGAGVIPKKLNRDALMDYLNSGYVLQPNSMIKDVYMLPPASYLVWKEKQFEINSYWTIEQHNGFTPSTEEETIKLVKELVEHSVKEETFADRPLGVFLSGGLDSTILIAAMKKSGVKEIKTFSVGFDGDELSEESDALATAHFYLTQHTQLQVTEQDILENLANFFTGIDQPSVDGLNTWLVSKVTAKHVTVALSGLGGDELFSGYAIDRKIIHRKKYKLLSALIAYCKPIWNPILPNKLKSKLNVVAKWKTTYEQYAQWGQLFNEQEARKLFPAFNYKHVVSHFKANFKKSLSTLNEISYLHLRTFMMSRLLRDSDALSMIHSIEVRFPLLDPRIASLMYQVEEDWKIKQVEQAASLQQYEKENSYETFHVKHILYQAFKGELPPDFGKRPKRGFRMPIEKWLRGELKDEVKGTLLDKHTILNKDALTNIWNKWENGEMHWSHIWSLYVLERWIALNNIHE